MTDISIVIVSWNVSSLLRDCLSSIEWDKLNGEVIVVDAASTDGTPDMVRSEFPDVRLVQPGENVGFSKGNNIGIEASQGRYVFMLNPDTRIVDDGLRAMFDYMEASKSVGILGPQLLNPDDSVQSSKRRFPTLWTGIFESTWLQPFAPKPVLDNYYANDLPDSKLSEVDWVDGAAMFARRDIIETVGGLDEGYFMYSEEIDWQRRVKANGWKIVYFPGAQIYHYRGASSDQVSTQRHIYFQNSKIRYFRKHHGRTASLFLRVFLLATYVWQIGLEWIKGFLGHKRGLRQQRIQAYKEILRNGLKGTI